MWRKCACTYGSIGLDKLDGVAALFLPRNRLYLLNWKQWLSFSRFVRVLYFELMYYTNAFLVKVNVNLHTVHEYRPMRRGRLLITSRAGDTWEQWTLSSGMWPYVILYTFTDVSGECISPFLLFIWLTLRPWRLRYYRYDFTRLHCVTLQNVDTLTTVRTSHLTNINWFLCIRYFSPPSTEEFNRAESRPGQARSQCPLYVRREHRLSLAIEYSVLSRILGLT
jgi:hypothetical protein